MKLIFQLGTNNWQTDDEPAPGSGILHESQHNIINTIPGLKNYSMFPSPKHTSTRPDYRVFKLSHNIPICESAGPVSSYRWHTMSEEEFRAYGKRLENEVYEYMKEIEVKEKTSFTLIIAHHSFLNPLVMRNVVARRVSEGKPHTTICCFLHGTGLKMFSNEMSGQNKEEYPMRFYKLLTDERIFTDTNNAVSLCLANSPALIEEMAKIFPTFPQDRIILALPGVDESIFHPQKNANLQGVLSSLGPPIWPTGFSSIDTSKYDKAIIFVGRLADWKRVDALLHAAQKYESELSHTCTLIVGGGAQKLKEWTELSEKLGLKSVYFVGPRPQPVLAQLFTVASVGVFPSFEEPFGMVFIECIACGCPVIGANSGGPQSFITQEVGELVPEPGMEGIKELSESLLEVITRSINENWKVTKREAGIKLAKDNFTAKALTVDWVEKVMKMVDGM